ncbi:MAG TPA: SDR family NAD(P)-dependent oxidoreductase [Candidatus Pacearchaeota archaeon]|nr:SDR family NAD(P)-dependent oxidoreductase [Candidatus Pacearchaeota archaeon]HPZ74471.1 SDR family NAD(P)-dependent oxidoreductase [Candidatus Pacearchaeota archaeon]HQD89000.1 SDR family NAD(P)-dependent oxidoreductase [Candidatus Pacearchaeota archaeon]
MSFEEKISNQVSQSLTGKVAIVSGARRGIGRAIALRLAKGGARVVVTDISKEDCQKVVDEIQQLGNDGLALKLDVTDEENIKEVIRITKETFGRIDILVNNAGIFIQEELDKMETQSIERELDINLKGAILCTKNVIPEMKQQNYGKIVTIASIAGFVGFDVSSVYCATKGGLIAMTKELAMELGQYKINVNAVAPGVIATDMTKDILSNEKVKEALLSKIPYGRVGEPNDIANAVAFLASDEAEYITGHTLVVDGGWITK